MSTRELKIDAAIAKAELSACEDGLGDGTITAKIATDAINFVYGTEYDTTTYTPVHQAIQRGTLKAEKLSGVVWLIDLNSFMEYLEQFRPRTDEQGERHD